MAYGADRDEEAEMLGRMRRMLGSEAAIALAGAVIVMVVIIQLAG
jgi:hypothetical protein